MKVLGIETSCDETGVALYDSEQGLLGHQLYSQIRLHEDYGGVVPELASRDHVQKLTPLLRQLFKESGVDKSLVDAVAYTAGPGLLGALMVGACAGQALAYAWGVPGIGVHHMEGHLLAPLMETDAIDTPFVALLVSGGHTQLIEVKRIGEYQLLGESVDDAAGEAFDKVAKMLNLGYPGGPQVARAAEQGDSERFRFPRPMTDRPGLDFSFSGLKTYCLNTIQRHQQQDRPLDPQLVSDVARAFQDAVVDTMVIKCKRAMKQTGLKALVVAGGVSANLQLRERLGAVMTGMGVKVAYPKMEFCTDNGAMIAYAGWQRLRAGQQDAMGIKPRARWPLTELKGLG